MTGTVIKRSSPITTNKLLKPKTSWVMCLPSIDVICTKKSHTHKNGLALGLDWTGQDLEKAY